MTRKQLPMKEETHRPDQGEVLEKSLAQPSSSRKGERKLSELRPGEPARRASSHSGSVYIPPTPTTHLTTPSGSSYHASAGYRSVDERMAYISQEAHSPPLARATSAEDFMALKTTMKGLGIELPDSMIAGLARKYDGMTSMERFLSEEGYWVPGSKSAVYHNRFTNQGHHHRRV